MLTFYRKDLEKLSFVVKAGWNALTGSGSGLEGMAKIRGSKVEYRPRPSIQRHEEHLANHTTPGPKSLDWLRLWRS